jgi:hypothetical protein
MSASLIAQLALATFVVTQFTKFLLDGLVSSSNPNQNNITRLYVYAVAIAVCALATPLQPVHGSIDALFDTKALLVAGFQVFVAAVATYHVANSLDTPAAVLSSVIGTLKPFDPQASTEIAPTATHIVASIPDGTPTIVSTESAPAA